MKTAQDHHQGSRMRWVGLGLVALGLVHASASSLEPVIQAAVPKSAGTASLLPTESAAPKGGWFQQLFHAAPSEPRGQAIQQIEALGLAVDANSCIRAVEAKNRRLIELFIRSGFDLNARGHHQRTPLLTAALGKDWPLVAELLKAGATPNLADESGATSLMAAAMEQSPAPLQSLLQAGADVTAKDDHGHSAIHYAVAVQNAPALTALLAAGVPATGTCCEGHDLVSHALETQNKEIISPVLEAQMGDLPWTAEARQVFTEALTARDAAYTRLFLTKFAGAPTPEGKAQPVLAYAVLENDFEKFRFLLECGADPSTPLNSPAEKSFVAQVPSAYTRSYLESESGMTTLMLAAGLQKLDFARALLAAGGKRHAITAKYKMSALYFAASNENPEMLQLLLGDSPTPDEVRIEISLGAQRAYLYKNNVSVFSTAISSGRSGFSTPTGKFVVTDKHAQHRSTLYPADMPYFMRLSFRDFGMHQGALPGYPASHGCIRLPGSAARQLYKDVPVGTLVSITR